MYRPYPLPSHARRFSPLPTTTRAAALFAALAATIGSCQTSNPLSDSFFTRVFTILLRIYGKIENACRARNDSKPSPECEQIFQGFF